MKIIVSGLGIIGGSMAKALTKYTDHTVLGMNRSRMPVEKALACGAISGVADETSLSEADIIILGTYPDASVEFLARHAGNIRKGCIVTDTAGIKTEVYPKLKDIADKNGFIFIGCHPMAGKEKNGFDASDAELFQGASCILLPGNAPEEAVDTLAVLMKSVGFGQVVYTDPEKHDRMISFTSQLPHVIACSYVLSPCCPEHDGFSAGSYRDVSRVANINAKLWSELFINNKKPLIEEMDIFISNMTAIRNAVEKGDRQELEELLANARKVKEGLGE